MAAVVDLFANTQGRGERELFLDSLVIDAGTQCRVAINKGIVEEYAEAYRAGERMPALKVFEVQTPTGQILVLARGFHRYHGGRLAGRTSLPCFVVAGTLEDAVLDAVGDNADHGLRRSIADRRKAVVVLFELLAQRGETWSDRRMAQQARVGADLVGDIRRALGALAASPAASDEELAGEVDVAVDLIRTVRQVRTMPTVGSDRTSPRLGADGRTRTGRTPPAVPDEDPTDRADDEEDEDEQDEDEEDGDEQGRGHADEEEDENPAAAQPAAASVPLPSHDDGALLDWKVLGKAWAARQKRDPDDRTKLTRRLAAEFREQLAAAAWGARVSGGDAAATRDRALLELVRGAERQFLTAMLKQEKQAREQANG